MKIIDTHVHIYPERIAEKATQSIGDFYELQMNCVGSVPELLKSGREAGIERYIVHSVAIAPKNVSTINNFVASEVKAHPEFCGFMTMHPNLAPAETEAEIERALSLGLSGIKMHPDIQQFDIDCDDAVKIYRAANNRMPILLHTGDSRYDYSSPLRLARVAKMFPETIFIGAHFGGYDRWQDVMCYLETPNVYFDTSSALFKLSPSDAASLIKKLGSHRFFFGTDFPIISHVDELKLFDRIPLSDTEKENILYYNAKEFLKL